MNEYYSLHELNSFGIIVYLDMKSYLALHLVVVFNYSNFYFYESRNPGIYYNY